MNGNKASIFGKRDVSTFFFITISAASIIALAIFFSAVDDGYCSTTAAVAVGKDEAYSCIEYWLNRYQSLIGGFLALAGAYLALWGVRSQIRQTENYNLDREERESDASRAILQLSLREITKYAESCIDFITALPGENEESEYDINAVTVPRFPEQCISILQDVVRHCNRKEADEIGDLIFHAQVQMSRLDDVIDNIRNETASAFSPNWLGQNLLDAADLYARAERLFEFARRSYNRHLVSAKEVEKALKIKGVELDNWPQIVLQLKLRQQAWEAKQKRTNATCEANQNREP